MRFRLEEGMRATTTPAERGKMYSRLGRRSVRLPIGQFFLAQACAKDKIGSSKEILVSLSKTESLDSEILSPLLQHWIAHNKVNATLLTADLDVVASLDESDDSATPSQRMCSRWLVGCQTIVDRAK